MISCVMTCCHVGNILLCLPHIGVNLCECLQHMMLLQSVFCSCAAEVISYFMVASVNFSKGLRWYAKRLRIDEDGDVADEFFDEVLPDTSSSVDEQHKPLPRFEVKYSTRPAKIKMQMMSHDGKIQQRVEHQGRLQWV
ncbi:uncharacterized protein LOC133701166 isoform X2 [Populus nigra]|uniref:uncharacterized protein LOC133701166 isoform X2 n=1 Tax=Populus nigra TaxID=3691 RepID=UPI002B274466|nr:uncharacterized protein LOC133701166 isoform X2 [Populus nigra]